MEINMKIQLLKDQLAKNPDDKELSEMVNVATYLFIEDKVSNFNEEARMATYIKWNQMLDEKIRSISNNGEELVGKSR